MIKGHGGNIHDAAVRMGCRPEDVIDMSSNMNPLGPPAGLMDYLRDQIESICTLPEVDAREIKELIAQKYGVPTECVLAGNGTTQFIYSIPRALGSSRVLIVGPTYSDYEDSCIMNHIEYSWFYAEEEDGYEVHLEKLLATIPNFDTVFICNPNNPTGNLIAAEDIATLCKTCPETYFIIDESYLPFADDPYRSSVVSAVVSERLSNVIVLNSMSKVYRVPGLRIGFLISSIPIIYKFAELSLPWTVNAMAQAAVRYLMKNETIPVFLEETRRFVSTEKELFLQRLADTPKLILFPGSVYYVIAKLDQAVSAEGLCKALEADRFLIRNCANFQGLPANYVRFSLKDRETNMRLADKVQEYLAKAG